MNKTGTIFVFDSLPDGRVIGVPIEQTPDDIEIKAPPKPDPHEELKSLAYTPVVPKKKAFDPMMFKDGKSNPFASIPGFPKSPTMGYKKPVSIPNFPKQTINRTDSGPKAVTQAKNVSDMPKSQAPASKQSQNNKNNLAMKQLNNLPASQPQIQAEVKSTYKTDSSNNLATCLPMRQVQQFNTSSSPMASESTTIPSHSISNIKPQISVSTEAKKTESTPEKPNLTAIGSNFNLDIKKAFSTPEMPNKDDLNQESIQSQSEIKPISENKPIAIDTMAPKSGFFNPASQPKKQSETKPTQDVGATNNLTMKQSASPAVGFNNLTIPTSKARKRPFPYFQAGIALIALSLGGLTGPFTQKLKLEAGYQAGNIKNEVVKALYPQNPLPESAPVVIDPLIAPDGTRIVPVNTDFSLIIPKIGVNAPVVEGVNPVKSQEYYQALKIGVAHASTSFTPDGNGTTYLFSHSTNYEWFIDDLNAVFYLVKELEPNDQIVIFYKGVRYTYILRDKRVVKPKSISYLVPDTTRKSLILQTCWPPGSIAERLLLFADLIDESGEQI